MNTNNAYANITDLGGPRVCERMPPVEFGGSSCPVVIEPERPDIEDSSCRKLRRLLAEIIQQRTYWQARADGEGNWKDLIDDSAELKAVCGQAAAALGPVIGAVTVAADEHERRLEEMESGS